MAYVQHNRYGVKDVSEAAHVPDNDIARLMYYLKCVCYTIEYSDNDINRYCNYNNWSSLSNEDIRVLIVLCYTLSPDVFDNRVFFQSDALSGNDANRFLEINQVNTQLLAARSIVIAGRTCRVNKIMTYKMSWMQTYYFNPMRNLAQRFNNKPTSRSSTCVVL